jgi:dCMP deaminase
MSLSRPSWDDYFLSLASLVATRSTCMRRQVGAVLVKDKRILCTGYNGAPSGLQHCSQIGVCLREQLKIPSGERHELCRGLHAEQNALIQAAKLGIAVDGATLYCTALSCAICAKMLINAGVVKIVYVEDYPDKLTEGLILESNIECIQKKG